MIYVVGIYGKHNMSLSWFCSVCHTYFNVTLCAFVPSNEMKEGSKDTFH